MKFDQIYQKTNIMTLSFESAQNMPVIIKRIDNSKKIGFVDIEASGFDGFPIEFGFCDVNLRGISWLLKIPKEWENDENFMMKTWDPKSEQIHNISKRHLKKYGTSYEEAALRINIHMNGFDCIVSDNPQYDQWWLNVLYYTSGVTQTFQISNFYSLINTNHEWTDEDIKLLEKYPHKHRALPDAQRMAMHYNIAKGSNASLLSTSN